MIQMFAVTILSFTIIIEPMCDEVKYVVINLMSIFFANKLIKIARTRYYSYWQQQ